VLPQSFGLPLVTLSAVALAVAYAFGHRGRPRAALAAILLVAASLRLFASGDRHLHEWDERYHALVAKNLIASPLVPTLYRVALLDYDYRDWLSNHVWLHKPPLTLWLMAMSMKAFGVNELAVRLPSLVFGTLSVGLTFLIARRLISESVALLAAGLHAINGLLLDLGAGRTATDHPDTLLIFLVALGAYLALRATGEGRDARLPTGDAEATRAATRTARWSPAALALVGLCAGAAVLTKSIIAGLVPVLWLVLVWRRLPARRVLLGLAILAATAAALAGPWIAYILRAFPREAAAVGLQNWLHVVTPLDGHGHGPLWYLYRLGRDYGELVYVPVAWFVLSPAARARVRGRGWAFLAAWLIVTYAAFSLAATKMPGYVAIAAPAVFIVTALFCEHVLSALALSAAASPRPHSLSAGASPRSPGGLRPRATRIAAWILLLLVLGLPARYAIERLRPSPSREREKSWVQPLRELDARFPDERVVLFNCERPIEAMFYSSHIAYPQRPSAAEIERVERAGYRPVILNE
jgi:4-amino-4-deoxy-L-arabinose transferase